MSWAEIKKAINDNFNYPLNKQHFYPTNFGVNAEYFEASTTYTAQQEGIYVVTCVGKGGDGLSNGTGYIQGTSNIWIASGGGGAVCKGYVKLYAGQTVSIVVDTTQSAFGSYISAGAGQNGTSEYSTQPAAPAGGAIYIAGNIFNHAGYPGSVGQHISLSHDLPGGNAGIITPWSLNAGYSQGYLPFINWTELTGGEPGSGAGKFGGGTGSPVCPYNIPGVRGGGGYGGGGNWNQGRTASGTSAYYAPYSAGGKGVVIVEHGTMFLG